MAATQPKLFDYDYRGGFDNSSNIRKVYNEDALINGLTMWLSSLSGEIVRLPAWGGYLYNMMYKPMREEEIDLHRMDILAGFNENFQPFSKVEDLVITPNYETRSWEIDLTISVSDFNYVVSFSGSLANLVNQ